MQETMNATQKTTDDISCLSPVLFKMYSTNTVFGFERTFNSQENHDRIYPCNNNTKTTTETTEGLLVVPGNIGCSEVKS